MNQQEKGLLQFRYLRESQMGFTEMYHTNVVIPNQDVDNIVYEFLKTLNVAGFSYEAVAYIFDQDIDEIIFNSPLRFFSEFEDDEEDEDEEQHSNLMEMIRKEEQPESDNRVSADLIESKAKSQYKFDEFANDPERIKGFIDQLKENPKLAKMVYKDFLEGLNE